ncbi:MAG: di-heme oxidoredictase family protein [Kofleriaceae bacterium]
MKVVFKITAAALIAAGCGGGDDQGTKPDATISTITNAKDVPIDGLSADDVAEFHRGDDMFDLPFREPDGLGPLFIRSSCGACHSDGSRGPGLVQKMAVVEADGVTTAPDQSELPFGHTLRQGLVAPAMTPITAPQASDVKVTIRIGPPVFGRGYLEAVADSEIQRVAAEQAQRTDAIHGFVAMSPFASVPSGDGFSTYNTGDMVIGRFGLKARVATLDDFTADAFQGDMGLTTPMRPVELANPDNLTDDSKPGVDLDLDHVNRVAFYVRRIAIPKRVGLTDQGKALFDQLQCSGCHVPTMHTRADYPIPQLADIDAPIYTDLLLHDMGDALSDGMVDGGSTSKAWRTAPLIGLRFTTIYMHDGRASSVADAIQAHAGEALASADAFRSLSQDDRDTLVAFVEAL